jgi:hypothetical protein
LCDYVQTTIPKSSRVAAVASATKPIINMGTATEQKQAATEAPVRDTGSDYHRRMQLFMYIAN